MPEEYIVHGLKAHMFILHALKVQSTDVKAAQHMSEKYIINSTSLKCTSFYSPYNNEKYNVSLEISEA